MPTTSFSIQLICVSNTFFPVRAITKMVASFAVPVFGQWTQFSSTKRVCANLYIEEGSITSLVYLITFKTYFCYYDHKFCLRGLYWKRKVLTFVTHLSAVKRLKELKQVFGETNSSCFASTQRVLKRPTVSGRATPKITKVQEPVYLWVKILF